MKFPTHVTFLTKNANDKKKYFLCFFASLQILLENVINIMYIVAVAFIVINCVNCEARDDIGMFRESADLRIVCESFLYLACIENNSMTLSILANSFELCSQRGKRKKAKRSRKRRKREGKEIQFNLFVTEILNSV